MKSSKGGTQMSQDRSRRRGAQVSGNSQIQGGEQVKSVHWKDLEQIPIGLITIRRADGIFPEIEEYLVDSDLVVASREAGKRPQLQGTFRNSPHGKKFDAGVDLSGGGGVSIPSVQITRIIEKNLLRCNVFETKDGELMLEFRGTDSPPCYKKPIGMLGEESQARFLKALIGDAERLYLAALWQNPDAINDEGETRVIGFFANIVVAPLTKNDMEQEELKLVVKDERLYLNHPAPFG